LRKLGKHLGFRPERRSYPLRHARVFVLQELSEPIEISERAV
jgi:hypothetical protein